MQGRCMKCQEQKEITGAEEVTMKNGAVMVKGKCATCGTTVCAFKKKESKEE